MYQEIKEKEEILTEIRHDIKNRNTILREYIMQNNLSQALKHRNKEKGLTKKTLSIIQTRNRIIDSVINSRIVKAKKANTTVELAIKKLIYWMKLRLVVRLSCKIY